MMNFKKVAVLLVLVAVIKDVSLTPVDTTGAIGTAPGAGFPLGLFLLGGGDMFKNPFLRLSMWNQFGGSGRGLTPFMLPSMFETK